MKIIDTSASFADVYGEGGFDLEKWKIYADGIRPGLRELCLADMEEVLSSLLICQVTPDMRRALQEISNRVPRWLTLGTSRVQ